MVAPLQASNSSLGPEVVEYLGSVPVEQCDNNALQVDENGTAKVSDFGLSELKSQVRDEVFYDHPSTHNVCVCACVTPVICVPEKA